MYLITFAKSLKYTHIPRNGWIFRFYVAILVSAKFERNNIVWFL